MDIRSLKQLTPEQRNPRSAAIDKADAASQLSDCTARLYHRLGFRNETISLSGGCFSHISVFRDAYLEHLASSLPSAEISDEETDPVSGGFPLYRQFILKKDD